MGGDIGELTGEDCQGTCIKDTWTKPKGVGSRVGGGVGLGMGHGRVKMETTVFEQ